MARNEPVSDLLCRQADMLAHAGEQLAAALAGNSAGVTVVRGLKREQQRLREQTHVAISERWPGEQRRPGRPGWLVRNLTCDLLTRPESESPSARALLLTDTLAELGECFEELAVTIRLRPAGMLFASAATYLADGVRTLATLVRFATRTGSIPEAEGALLREYLRRLNEQHWQVLASGSSDTTGVILAIGRAFAATAGVLQGAAEATFLFVDRDIAGTANSGACLPAVAPAALPFGSC